jgi:hypothetical protein
MWTIILKHPKSDLLKLRFIEELIDINSTTSCFTGHVNRLVNVFSSFEMEFGEFRIGISIKNDMRSKFYHILSSIADEKTLGAITSDSEEDRKIVNEFSVKYLNVLIEKLRAMCSDVEEDVFQENLTEILQICRLV